MKKVPEFRTKEEELAFWDKHDPEAFDAGPAKDIILDIKAKRRQQDCSHC